MNTPAGRLPDFLCIGAQKSATSWLNANLMRHPDIWIPPIKELHFFDHLFIPRFRTWTRRHIHNHVDKAIRRHLKNNESPDLDFLHYLTTLATQDLFTERWYRGAFSWKKGDGKCLGETTPEYSTIPADGIAYLRQLLGEPRLIYIIRDPADRAMSQMRMNLLKRFGDQAEPETSRWSLRRWRKELDNDEIHQRGHYSAYVQEWDRQFAPERMLYLPYGRIGEEPLKVLAEVESFLGLRAHNRYPKANERIHRLRPLPIPPAAEEAAREIFAREREFIRLRFGDAFANLT
ncbi:sulfotransferase [Marinihelvus fidelis]|nr:sulfotransferase [Marinihelvus fidelis]